MTSPPWDSRLVDACPAAAGCRRQSALLLRRRRNITAPNKTARTPQIRRKVVVSIKSSPSPSSSANYMFSISGNKSRTRCVITGPMVTTNSDGSTQKKIGKTSFTASLDARSSALCRAITRR